jgi:hypothetical protein
MDRAENTIPVVRPPHLMARSRLGLPPALPRREQEPRPACSARRSAEASGRPTTRPAPCLHDPTVVEEAGRREIGSMEIGSMEAGNVGTPGVRPRAAAGQWWRPSPAVRKTVTVVHVAASVGLLGEVWGLTLLNLAATLTGDGTLAHSAYRLMSVLVFGGGIPLSLTSLVSGVALAAGSPWGLTRYHWVFAKLLLNIAVIMVGMLLFTPEAMADATAGGAAAPAGRQWWQVAIVLVQLAMLLTAVSLSVFKPRRRIRWRRIPAGVAE